MVNTQTQSSGTILVTYATRSGSTAEVAHAIGDILQTHAFKVDVLPMQEVTDIASYDAVVAGSAIRVDNWLPEAMQFMRRNQAALQERPFASFLVCLAMAQQNEAAMAKARHTASSWLQPVRDLVQPVSEGLFAGTLQVRKVPEWYIRVILRVVTTLRLFKEGDYRNWESIRDWADDLAIQLQPGAHTM